MNPNGKRGIYNPASRLLLLLVLLLLFVHPLEFSENGADSSGADTPVRHFAKYPCFTQTRSPRHRLGIEQSRLRLRAPLH